MYITYESFKNKLNTKLTLGQDFYNSLVVTILKYPTRYVSDWRINSPMTKLIQNVTQSREIKFGDFVEDITTEYIGLLGYTNLDKNIKDNESDDILNVDQLFLDNNNNVYIIEQKMRDDHDSTKKRGQFLNYIRKIKSVHALYPDRHIICAMWFVDDTIFKNNSYYKEKMKEYEQEIKNLNAETHLFYGKTIWEEIFHNVDVWNEMKSYNIKYKTEARGNNITIPDFDNSEEIRIAVENLSKNYKKKLLSDNPLYVEIRKEFFPQGTYLQNLI